MGRGTARVAGGGGASDTSELARAPPSPPADAAGATSPSLRDREDLESVSLKKWAIMW